MSTLNKFFIPTRLLISPLAVAIVAIALLTPGKIFADIIVNTGPGASAGPTGLTLDSEPGTFQDLGGEFTLTSATTITSVEGWIFENVDAGSFGGVTIAIGSSPGDLLFSGVLQSSTVQNADQWEGLTGLDWSLDAGNYWVSFIANLGFIGNMNGGAANPLSDYAFDGDGSLGGWLDLPGADLGVMITGTPDESVPDSGSTFVMIGLAMAIAGLGLIRRRAAPGTL